MEKPSLWRSIVQSLRGEEHDYTAESLNRAVFLLSVPMVLEMLMESLFAITDIFWVSHLGKNAVAVVGITESVMSLVYAVAIGMCFAASAIVSRRIGEKDPERASQAAGQIVVLGILMASGMGVVLGYFAEDILRLMSQSEAVVEMGTPFIRIMLGGNITVFMIFLINAIFRGAGDAVIAMRTLMLANVINMALGPCFVFGWGPFPEMGVTGAAVATNIGRGIGVLYQLWHLLGHHSRIHVHLYHLRPAREVLHTIISTSKNGIAQLLISTTSWVGLYKILAMFHEAALAGYTIALRLIMFMLLPAWGIANAGSTLVGQNLGAERPDRAERAVWIAVKWNTIFLGAVGVLYVIFAHSLASIFASEPDVLHEATRSLWIVSLAFPFYAAGMCFEGAFNGSGDTWTPTRLNFFCFWLGQVPLALIFAVPLKMGALGVYIAVPVSFGVLTLWSAVLFRRGKWKEKKV
ncbi:MATE family efflux transporter [Roseimicrobium sp. ORNL1]|uniref:MATE family efflux transporter n=1 Tax=Roseimicrobium sp. ORNL1 TaxID=2711231 RepID=UPI0013E11517|nr:MATE family efflux transporter [Roseimicrobium sp. ORNL1]QIF05520.1 MATE family efflux transporter [Roseimicrobium sp. ORNL1]